MTRFCVPGERLVEGRVLGGDPDVAADCRGLAHDVEAGDPCLPAVGHREGREDPQRRRLAGAVRAEETDDRPAGDRRS